NFWPHPAPELESGPLTGRFSAAQSGRLIALAGFGSFLRQCAHQFDDFPPDALTFDRSKYRHQLRAFWRRQSVIDIVLAPLASAAGWAAQALIDTRRGLLNRGRYV